MLSVDLAITAGGQTTYELARCGVPMIMIEVVSNQRGNIRGFNELGIPCLEGYKENTEFINQLSNYVEKLESFDLRNTIREKYSQIHSSRLSEWINDFICYHSEK
jgi:UDP-2,4-diacetamido-2,4,6-trideoxy-beta-L-altropyranose hydrolase